MFVVKTLVAAILPVIIFADGSFDKRCLDLSGNPRSSDPFKVPGDCYYFYQCSNGYLHKKMCPTSTVFNPIIKVCDWPANVPGCEIFTVLACENDLNVKASCPFGEVIVVKDGFYGRDEGSSCPHPSIKTTDCSADGSLEILKKACNGKNSCTLEPTNSVFGDPCVNTYKFIKMNYYCKLYQGRWNKATICEGNKKTLSCPAGTVIWVNKGYYGRDDGTTCPHKSIKTTTCSAEKSLASLRKTCNGKNSCVVQSSNSVFGDPCVNTYKYVEMTYLCRKKSKKWNKATICENKSQTLSCPVGSVIFVKKGYYGRDDSTTCPHSSIKTTTCSADESLEKLRKTCNGKNSCVVESSNSVFGDPCVNTYKYVEMIYLCHKKAAEPCHDSSGNPISTNPFKKPGDCGHFYQCSNGYLHTMPCAPGTVFNPRIGVCDHPQNVPGCS